MRAQPAYGRCCRSLAGCTPSTSPPRIATLVQGPGFARIVPRRSISATSASAAGYVTSPSRTLLDLAGTSTTRELEQALAEAQRRQLAREHELLSLLSRHRGRPGTARLRALLDDASHALTRSVAEERFLALIGRARLPPPDVNTPLRGYQVDFLWRKSAWSSRSTATGFTPTTQHSESDRRRDAQLEAQGYRVMRVTWRQLVDEPQATPVLVAQALARATP
jgi:very-short-patch-repair endonuclease